MKYRIKYDGCLKLYFPQRKLLCFWVDMDRGFLSEREATLYIEYNKNKYIPI